MTFAIPGLVLALALVASTVPADAQTGAPRVVVQPVQTGTVTGGTSGAVNPRLDPGKGPAESKDAAPAPKDKPAEADRPPSAK